MASLLETVALIAPNIDVVRHTSLNANKDSEQEKFDKIKTSIEEAAATGAEEVVIAEKVEDLYVQLLKDAGYNVCVGKYNGTEKVCTLIEWRDSFSTKWYNEVLYRDPVGEELFNGLLVEITVSENSVNTVNTYVVDLKGSYSSVETIDENNDEIIEKIKLTLQVDDNSPFYSYYEWIGEGTISEVEAKVIESDRIVSVKPEHEIKELDDVFKKVSKTT